MKMAMKLLTGLDTWINDEGVCLIAGGTPTQENGNLSLHICEPCLVVVLYISNVYQHFLRFGANGKPVSSQL